MFGVGGQGFFPLSVFSLCSVPPPSSLLIPSSFPVLRSSSLALGYSSLQVGLAWRIRCKNVRRAEPLTLEPEGHFGVLPNFPPTSSQSGARFRLVTEPAVCGYVGPLPGLIEQGKCGEVGCIESGVAQVSTSQGYSLAFPPPPITAPITISGWRTRHVFSTLLRPPPPKSRLCNFAAAKSQLQITSHGTHNTEQRTCLRAPKSGSGSYCWHESPLRSPLFPHSWRPRQGEEPFPRT